MKKVDKEEAERWLEIFMPLYEETAPLAHKISEVNADGLPTDLIALKEISIKLPPILKSMKEMPKPKNKELCSLKKDLKLSLDACIKASKWVLKLNQKPSRVRFSVAVFWTSLAISFTESLSQRLALLSGHLNYGG
jgi:hypothetical protein